MVSDVTAVVTTHDGGEDLVALANELAEAGFARVLVVDSGSTDGAPARVAGLPGVEVVALEGNPGPCVARNEGLRRARTPLVLLVDDDMRLGEGCVAALLEEMDRERAFVMAGPRILHHGSEDQVQYEGGYWHFAGLPHMRGQDGRALPGDVSEVDVLTAGCVLVRRDPVLAAGGFDRTFFFLMEDVELSLRLRWLGHRLAVVPRARCWNRGGSAGLSLDGARYPERRAELHARNRLLLVLGLYDGWSLFLLWPALVVMDAAWALFALLSGRGAAFLRGRVDLLRRAAAIRVKRRAFLPRKRVRDKDLLKAPPLTFTRAALAQPAAARLTGALDSVLRLCFTVVRGALP